MREPWETLLGHYRARWCIGDYLEDDFPHLRQLEADERYPGLSSGERAMVEVAKAILTINQAWLEVDEDHRRRIEHALRIACDG